MGSAVNPLEIFPPEVWTIVTGWIPHPKDLLSCRLVCKLFRDILWHDQTRYLFPNVIGIVAKTLSKSRIRVPQRDILNLRLVCRTWKHSLVTHPDCYWLSADGVFSIQSKIQRKICRFDNIGTITKFVDTFKEYKSCFGNELQRFAKCITLKGTVHNHDVYWNTVCTFLEIFGNSVESVAFENLCANDDILVLLKRVLSLTPNVISIEFNYTRDFRSSKCCKMVNLPNLDHLQNLKLLNVDINLTNTLFKSYCKQLCTVSILYDSNFESEAVKMPESRIALHDFPKPMSLTCRFEFLKKQILKSFEGLKELTIDVKKYVFNEDGIYLHLAKLNLSNLESLTITPFLSTESLTDKFTDFLSTLKSLKTLKISFISPAAMPRLTAESDDRLKFSIESFCNLKNLEFLSLVLVDYKTLVNTNRKSGEFQNLYKSHVWRMLPKLAKVQVFVVSKGKLIVKAYSRHCYNLLKRGIKQEL